MNTSISSDQSLLLSPVDSANKRTSRVKKLVPVRADVANAILDKIPPGVPVQFEFAIDGIGVDNLVKNLIISEVEFVDAIDSTGR